MAGSAIFVGRVVHDRVRPRRHRLSYGVYSLLLDLDELAALDRRLRLFGYNRRAPLAFFDADHGPTTGAALRPWVETLLRRAGLVPDGGPIRLLCYPRVFGFVFNPLSVYFCYRRAGELAAILYEVCNTHRERHTYVIPCGPDAAAPVVRQACAKAHFVSPFIGMECRYRFAIRPPSDGVSVVIRQEDAQGRLLAASFRGVRQTLSDRALARLLLRFPFLTLKIVAGIHWQALKLWAKGFPVFAHKQAVNPVDVSIQPVARPFREQS